MSVPSSTDAVADLISSEYPNFRHPDFEVICQESKEGGAPQYKAKIRLFDQVIITTGTFATKEDAEMAAAQQAKEALNEFVSIQLSNLPENIKQVIAPIDRAMKAFDVNGQVPTTFPKVEPVDGLGAGNDPVNIIRVNEEELNSVNSATVETKDPITFLHQMAAKARQTYPEYSCFEQLSKHGCKLTFDGATVSVPATHSSKTDAKRAAAKLLCEQLFSDYPRIKFLGPTVEAVEVIKPAEILETTELTEAVEKPKETVTVQPPTTLSAMSQLNLWCQKSGVPLPEFNFEDSDNGKGVFVCKISAFGFTAKSGPYSKKAQAKEEAAKSFLAQLVGADLQKLPKPFQTFMPQTTTVGKPIVAPSVIPNSTPAIPPPSTPSPTSDVVMSPPLQHLSQSQPPSHSQSQPQSIPITYSHQHQQQPHQQQPFNPQTFPNFPQMPMMHPMYGNPYMAMPPMWPNPYAMHMMGMYGQSAPQPPVPSTNHNQPPPNQPNFPGMIHMPNQQPPILPPGSLLMMPPQPHQPPQPNQHHMMMPPPFMMPPHPYHHMHPPSPNPTGNNGNGSGNSNNNSNNSNSKEDKTT